MRLLLILLLLFVGSCTVAVTERLPERSSVVNQGTECVNYDPQVDYFPTKTNLQYAKGFQVDYHKHYKIVTVKQPFRTATTGFQYVLVQCGAPVPDGFAKEQVIRVPVTSVVTLSTTHIPHLERLDVLDRLVGVANADLIYSRAVQAKLQDKTTQEVSKNNRLNYEQIVSINPDLITTFAIGDSASDNYPKLMELGLRVAINGEYLENSPLAQAEWLKFTALFFNREGLAAAEFQKIERKYQEMAGLAKGVGQRPTVITGLSRSGVWAVAGGRSFLAQYLRDAGADYVWRDDPSIGAIPLSFEAVFERGIGADFWLVNTPDWVSLAEVSSADLRYREFKAFREGRVFNNNLRVGAGGGNDYWESGILSPDLVLADLVAIFHPQLLPQHRFVYFRRLK